MEALLCDLILAVSAAAKSVDPTLDLLSLSDNFVFDFSVCFLCSPGDTFRPLRDEPPADITADSPVSKTRKRFLNHRDTPPTVLQGVQVSREKEVGKVLRGQVQAVEMQKKCTLKIESSIRVKLRVHKSVQWNLKERLGWCI